MTALLTWWAARNRLTHTALLMVLAMGLVAGLRAHWRADAVRDYQAGLDRDAAEARLKHKEDAARRHHDVDTLDDNDLRDALGDRVRRTDPAADQD